MNLFTTPESLVKCIALPSHRSYIPPKRTVLKNAGALS